MKYELLILYLLIINISAFILYGIDKKKAIKHKFRISENTLIFSAFIGGSVGAFLGMQFFRHKTKHPKFIIGVPVCFIINVIIILLYFRNNCNSNILSYKIQINIQKTSV